MASLIGASLWFGAGQFAFAQSVKVEFPAKPDLTELPEVWPEEAGVDSDQLVKLSQWIRDQKLDVRSLVIVKDGKIAFERYSSGLTRDKNYELYSVTKALIGILAGDLIGEGKITSRQFGEGCRRRLAPGSQGRPSPTRRRSSFATSSA